MTALATTPLGLQMPDARLGADALLETWRGAAAAERPRLWLTAGVSAETPDPLGPLVCRTLGIPYVLLEPDPPAAPSDPFARTLAAAALTVCIGRPAARGLGTLLRPDQGLLALPPFVDTAPLIAMAHLRAQHRATVASHLRLTTSGIRLITDLPMTPGDALDGYRMLGLALSRMAIPGWTLVVAGDGPASAQVEVALRDLGATRLRFWRRTAPEHLLVLFAASDIYLWPAGCAGGAESLLRAQGLGMPVVACRSEATAELVQHGRCGRLTAPDSSADFGNALSFLLRHPEFRETYGRQARDHVLSRHDLNAVGAELYRALRALATQGQRDHP